MDQRAQQKTRIPKLDREESKEYIDTGKDFLNRTPKAQALRLKISGTKQRSSIKQIAPPLEWRRRMNLDRRLASRAYNKLKQLNTEKQSTQCKIGHGLKQRTTYNQEEPSLQQSDHSSNRAWVTISCYLCNPAAHCRFFSTLSMIEKENHD